MQKWWMLGLIIALAGVLGYSGMLPALAQLAGPSLEIEAPYAGQVVEGPKLPLSVTFRNSGNVPMIRFDAYLDGKQFFGGSFTNPLSSGSFDITEKCDITKAQAAPGMHKLTIRLTDAQGRIGERSQMINYQPINIRPIERNPPRVRIIDPLDGATINQKTDIRIEATDDSGIKLVKLFIDGKSRAMTSLSTYAFSWDPIAEKYATGSHTLQASAWDLFDNQGDSLPIMVMVDNSYLPLSNNLTPIEAPPTVEPAIGLVLVAEVAPSTLQQSLTRLPFSSLARPSLLPSMSTLLPDMASALPRLFSAPAAQVALVLPAAQLSNEVHAGDMSIPALAGLPGFSSIAGEAPTALTPGTMALILPRESVSGVGPVAVETGSQDAPRVATTSSERAPIGQTPVVVAMVPTISASPAMVPAAPSIPGALDAPVTVTLTPSTPVKAEAPSITLAQPSVPVTTIQQPKVTLPATQSIKPATPSVKPTVAMPPVKAPVTVAQTPAPVVKAPAPATKLVTKSTVTPTTKPPVAVKPVVVAPKSPEPLSAVKKGYTVKAGDTLTKIAAASGTTVEVLTQLNPAVDAQNLTPGMQLNVPRRSAQLLLDSKEITGGPAPYIAGEGYTMVPMRALVQAKDGVIVWLPKTRQVNAWVKDNFMIVTIGKREARLNADLYLLPVAATIRDARTMVPLRFVAKGMQVEVKYDPATKTYALSSQPAN